MDIPIGSDSQTTLEEELGDRPLLSLSQSKDSGDQKRSHISEILEEEEEISSMKFQMQFILKKLKEVHSPKVNDPCGKQHHPSYWPLLEKAEQALSNNKVIEAAQWLQQVLYDDALDKATSRRHMKIIEQAKQI